MELNSKPGEGDNEPNEIPRGIVDKSMKDHSNDPCFVRMLAEARRSFAESNFGTIEDDFGINED
jgi:hypothetical protein